MIWNGPRLDTHQNLENRPDGTYRAVITVSQKFTGYTDNNIPVYEDTTVKTIEVILRPIQLRIEDESVDGLEWDLLLGNISVSQTRAGR